MQASLDGELVDQDGRKGILEIKTTNILQSMQYEKWKTGSRITITFRCFALSACHRIWVCCPPGAVAEQLGTDVRTQVKHYFIERAEVQADLDYLQDEEMKF